jgi:hypothetical protein
MRSPMASAKRSSSCLREATSAESPLKTIRVSSATGGPVVRSCPPDTEKQVSLVSRNPAVLLIHIRGWGRKP